MLLVAGEDREAVGFCSGGAGVAVAEVGFWNCLDRISPLRHGRVRPGHPAASDNEQVTLDGCLPPTLPASAAKFELTRPP